ncbi:hypothetical protein NM688_g916 [Phlebia brevispora]|uniref:Uncharacterized protein n=1 Tax=Phlebia brevispora TaxID=194682 RepID=A0ACC1TD84_9APHY|nr:hypothetical protein NM688_g916 [Phlebia brevispora]
MEDTCPGESNELNTVMTPPHHVPHTTLALSMMRLLPIYFASASCKIFQLPLEVAGAPAILVHLFAIFAAVVTVSPALAVPALAVPARLANRQTITENGTASYYEAGLGACDITNQDSDFIVAISSAVFNSWPGATSNPSRNPICDQKMVVTYGSKSVTVRVTDECMACSPTDIALSLSAFDTLASPALGHISVTWTIE